MVISLALCRAGFPDHPYGVVLSASMIDSLVEMVTFHLYGMHEFNANSADDIFKCIVLKENYRILIKISLLFAPKSTIDNKPALVQVMAWRRIGGKPLHEPMMTQITDAYICGTRGRWVKYWNNVSTLTEDSHIFIFIDIIMWICI